MRAPRRLRPIPAGTDPNTARDLGGPRQEARRWLDVVRLAERERRRDAGEPLMKLDKPDKKAA